MLVFHENVMLFLNGSERKSRKKPLIYFVIVYCNESVNSCLSVNVQAQKDNEISSVL